MISKGVRSCFFGSIRAACGRTPRFITSTENAGRRVDDTKGVFVYLLAFPSRRREKATRLIEIFANEQREIKELLPGNIGVAVGFKEVRTLESLENGLVIVV